MRHIVLILALLNIIPAAHAQEDYIGAIAIKCWHDELAKQIGLKKDQFKIRQGAEMVGSTSEWLWNIFNAIPRNDGGIYYDPSRTNQFSTDYGLILSSLPSVPVEKCNLSDALLKYFNASPKYIWDKTRSELLVKLLESKSLKFIFDTTIVDTICGAECYISTVSVRIDASFSHAIVFTAAPYTVADKKKPIPENYLPWYTPCVLVEAYDNPNFKLWDAAFGSNGFMRYVLKSLVVVEGEDVTILANSKKVQYFRNAAGSLPCCTFDKLCCTPVDTTWGTYKSHTKNSSQNTEILLGVSLFSIKDYLER